MKSFKRRVTTSRSVATVQRPDDWKSFKLTKRNIIPLLVTNLALIATLTVVLILSNNQDGFGLPEKRSVRKGNVDWRLSLTWTFVPSFVLQVFALWFATTIDALGFRQPFVELARGAPADKSVHLDYSSFWPFQKQYKAWKLGHLHLLGLLSFSLLLKPTLGPLGAHLLAEGPYTRKTLLDQDVSLTTGVTSTGNMGWNLPTVISLAGARLSDSSYGRWSDGNRTFLNFSIPSTSSSIANQPRLVASTTAYFSTLECSVLPNLQEHLFFVDTRAFFTNNDSACSWTFNTVVTSTSPTHLETFGTSTCSDLKGRIVVVSGTINSTTDYDLSIISCTPLYWSSMVDLTLDLAAGAAHPIIDSNEHANSVKGARPLWWNIYEDQLQQQLTSPDLSGGSISQVTTPVGKVILDRTRAKSKGLTDSDNLLATTAEVWSALYSVLLEAYMIKPAEKNTEITGYLTTSDDRLFAVKPIIATVLALLGIIALSLVFVFVYTARHVSVLQEEPVGVLGYADLLADSCLTAKVKEMRVRSDYDGKVSETFLSEYARSAKSTTFRMDNLTDFKRRRIVAASTLANDTQNVPLLN